MKRSAAADGSLYDDLATTWWDSSGILHALGLLLDPVRLPFVLGTLQAELGPGPHRILDLGAGGCRLAFTLSENGHSVIALDPSVASLRTVKERRPTNGRGVGLVGGAGEQLPFAKSSFDAVVCMEVLEHVDDVAAVMAETARVLRPAGIFIFSGPNRSVVNRVGLVGIAQDLLGLIPRGTHRWHRLVRADEMDGHMRGVEIEPGTMVGVGVRLRNAPRSVMALIGLLAKRLSHPEAASRIELTVGRSNAIAYQGYGRRR